MRPIRVTCGPYSAASANSIVASTTPTNGTALTLASTTVDSNPRRLLVTAAANEGNAETLTIVGTTWGSAPATEVLSISTSTTTFISSLDYLTITSITPTGSLAWTQAITIGTTASTTVGSSPPIRLDDYAPGPVAVQVNVNGTITYTVETSLDDPNVATPNGANSVVYNVTPATMVWVADPNLTSQTTTKQDAMVARSTFIRLTINSVTSTATANATFSQVGGTFLE